MAEVEVAARNTRYLDCQGALSCSGAPLMPSGVAAAVSVLAGLLLDVAFPDIGWWPAAFLGVALGLAALVGRRPVAAFGLGLLFGTAFYVAHVAWVGRFLGPLPWLGLAGLQALLFAAGAVPISLVFAWSARVLPGRWSQLTIVPLLVGGTWTLREVVVGMWPYGGFPWARLGMSQAGGPLAETVSWLGVTGLSFMMAAICAAGLQWLRAGRAGNLWGQLIPLALVGALAVVPQSLTTPAGELTVGWAQGDGPAGYFDAAAPGSMLAAQSAASAPLFGRSMDVLVWPEGGVDSDPLNNRATAEVLDGLVQKAGAPLLLNAATARDGKTFNTSLLWTADESPIQLFDKAHPVPFGEYVPDRWLYGLFVPELTGLIQREYTPGSSPPFMRLDDVGIGLAICFDVIFDDVIWAGARQGAQVYLLQSNNGDFRGTDENLQQAAFARMRAIETGRAVINVSTTGTSQAIAPDGTVLDVLDADIAGARITTVPLRTGITPAVIGGYWIAGLIAGGSAISLIVLGFAARRTRAQDDRSAP